MKPRMNDALRDVKKRPETHPLNGGYVVMSLTEELIIGKLTHDGGGYYLVEDALVARAATHPGGGDLTIELQTYLPLVVIERHQVRSSAPSSRDYHETLRRLVADPA